MARQIIHAQFILAQESLSSILSANFTQNKAEEAAETFEHERVLASVNLRTYVCGTEHE